MKPLRPETTEEIAAIAREKGCRLLAIEPSGGGPASVVRLVLEREDGSAVSVEDCEAVSREVSTLLDATDDISHAYTLEVSSAGLDRKLYTIDDARRFVGRRVKVKTESPVVPERTTTDVPERTTTDVPEKTTTDVPERTTKDVPEQKERAGDAAGSRNLRGRLESVDRDVLRVVDEENRKTYNVRFGDIRLARLEYEWPERGGQRRNG